MAYGPDPAQHGDICVPVGAPQPGPAMVVIHGGGWQESSRKNDAGWCAVLAANGIVAFNIDYRLASPTDESHRWPAQLTDARLAVLYLRAHAGEYGVDPARIGAMGDSAGGHLALLLSEGVEGDGASAVSVVVDQFGPTDLTGLDRQFASSFAGLFGTGTPSAARLRAASPIAYVAAGNPPVLIVQGDADALVPQRQSTALLDALRKVGVPVELITYPGGHGYSGLSKDQYTALVVQVVAYLKRTL